jgi:putative oxidoreductase
MKKIFATNANNWTALFARLALGITIFPHGAQKLLGWFGTSTLDTCFPGYND